eukprot:CAMPEP_0119263004 /NCGR_PEP_ID=MMETSP1329-20130426/2548_1 /TAXON_ID=114041 /ORGANISM="Genus nov. species nov., Strain RCC1024" /LENGTH=245 /DNA_ID=CAMNT_0007262695 /DNA_START=210 /DNA_END=944 /DNA_ORIENTATION=+
MRFLSLTHAAFGLRAAPRRLVVRRAASDVLHLHEGCRALPPMVQADGEEFGLPKGLVRPPSADALWEWLEATGRSARDPDPSWADVWDSARHLSAYIRRHPETVEGRTVVDLGCGLGVVGISAALAGADVALLDREPEALHCAMSTAALNGVTVTAHVNDDCLPRSDIVLASDVLYDPSAAAALAAAFQKLGKRALVADPAAGRAMGARTAFLDAVAALGGAVDERPLDEAQDAEACVLLMVVWE